MTGFKVKSRSVKTFDMTQKGGKSLMLTLDGVYGLDENVKAKKIYVVGGIYYLYASDNVLYVREESRFYRFVSGTFSTPPNILEFNVDCVRTVLIVGGGRMVCKQRNTETELDIPYGRSMAYFKDKLFLTDGYKLYYSKPTMPFDFGSGEVSGGYYVSETRYGEILELFPDTDVLYLICEKGIIAIDANGDENSFSTNVLPSPHLYVKDGSVAYTENICYFITSNKVGVLKGGKVNVYDVGFPKDVKAKQCETFMDYYVVNCKIGNKYKLYYCDECANIKGFLDSVCMVGKEGYSADDDGLTFYRMEEVNSSGVAEGKYDFETSELKTITGIDIKIQGSAVLKIAGDFGERLYRLNNGNNVAYCNSESVVFSVSFVEKSSDFIVEKMDVKYKTYGG